MIDIDLNALGLEFGTGAVIGLLMGFAAKKVAKLVAIIVGVQLVIFRYLESRGILIVDWDALSAGLISASEHADPSYLETVISTLSVGAGFTAGFLIGFRRG
ncbi:FUN14 domain-containing protein [Natronobiforma cellulositropha]|uniref:FUN14 domain-containing protein n=1 Tax=Natronobiforma cellulositropha TaxID=1679076 RepID=UPI0021D59303|nr:FUN14 domain-containing protein [Natronobiforma cellulositropha]